MTARSLRRRARALLRLQHTSELPDLTADAVDLYQALRTLPSGQRQVLVLHHLAGLPVAEVAAELGLPAGRSRPGCPAAGPRSPAASTRPRSPGRSRKDCRDDRPRPATRGPHHPGHRTAAGAGARGRAPPRPPAPPPAARRRRRAPGRGRDGRRPGPPRRLARAGPTPLAPAGPPPERVNRFLGWWQDNIDAGIFPRQDASAVDRQALARRLARLPEADRVWFETREQALDRYRTMFSDRPDMTRNLDAAALPEAFRVRLRGPEAFARLHGHLCGTTRPAAKRCSPTIDLVRDQRAALFRTLSGRTWAGRVDASILLDPRASQADVAAVRRALEATPGVTQVVYEPRAAAVDRLQAEFGHKSAKNLDLRGPGGIPASFRLRVDGPATVSALQDHWCRNPTGAHDVCTGGVLLVVDQTWLETGRR
jgi:cell division protein FtsX